MSLTKDRLIADATDLTHSDKVASVLLAGDTVLTSTDISGKKCLDVNVASAIEVSVDHATDSIKIGDGTNLAGVTANNELKVKDADALSKLTDIEADTTILAGAVSSGKVQVDVISQPALNSATDSVTVVQGTNPWIVQAQVPNSSIKSTAVAGSATAVALPSTPLANRKNIYIQNNTNKDIFIGGSDVTITNGLKIAKGATIDFPFGASVAVYAIGGAGISGNINILEIA